MAVADFSRINSNIGALNALNSLNNVNKNLGMHQMRLATGRRINSAADDPAGLTIATKFRVRNEGLKTAMDNIGDAQNLMSVAEGGLNKIQDILVEMRNKAEQAASDTLGTNERTAIQQQLSQYAQEIDDIVGQTTWNGQQLLDGLVGFGGTINFQTGAEVNEVTKLTSGQFGSVAVDGGALSGLATVVGASAATPDAASYASSAGTTVLGDFTVNAGVATSAGLNELSSGNYTIRIVVNDANDAAGATAQLLKDGQAVMVDDGDGLQALSQVFSTQAGGQNVDFGNGLSFDIAGADLDGAGTIEFDVAYARVGDYTVDVSDHTTATTYMGNLDSAIETVSGRLQTVGALSSRLSFKEENLAEAQINTEAAFNRIMNADMAMSQLEATKYQILQQTATSMLAQANQAPQGLLSLFR